MLANKGRNEEEIFKISNTTVMGFFYLWNTEHALKQLGYVLEDRELGVRLLRGRRFFFSSVSKQAVEAHRSCRRMGMHAVYAPQLLGREAH